MRLISLLACAMLLAGCLSTPSDGEAEDGAPTGRDADQAMWLTGGMGFAAAPEEERAAVRFGSFYAAWAAGDDYPTWESDPFPNSTRVTRLSIRLLVDATGPVLESPRFPDLMAYGGAGGSWIGFASTNNLTHMVPGQPYAWETDLALPEGGLWIPAGERLGLKIVPVMMQNDAADVVVLVGGEDGSAISWTQEAGPSLTATLEAGSAEGQTTGSAYAGSAAPASTRHETPVTLDANAQALLVWMNTTQARGVPDIDLAIVGPDGEEIASSGTPTPREFIRLGPQNLRGGGEYRIVTTSYGSAQASFTVEWLAG